MTDCANVDIRDVLPEFLHGTLDRSASERVLAHLGTCAECSAELQLIRAIFLSAAAPRVDAARVATAIPPYQRRRFRFVTATRQLGLAAAFLICAAGISTIAVTHYHGAGQTTVTNHVAAAPAAGISIVGVSDLSDDHLEQLIGEMDQLEAAPPAEPESVVPADVEGGA